MTANRGLFVRQTGSAPSAVGTTPTQARLALAGLVYENEPGVPRSGLLGQSNFNVVTGTAATSPMSYDVGPLTAVVNRSANEGVYVFAFTGTTNVVTTAAPGSGSRWDLIYVKQNDPDKGDADNNTIVGVVQGTASAGTPTKPYSDPAVVAGSGALVLAEAQVFAGATATNGASVVITQVFPYTAARRGECPIRNDTDLATLTSPALGAAITRRDRTGARYTWDGSTWLGGVRMEARYAPSAITGFSVTGNIMVEQVGTYKRVTADINIQRTGSGLSITDPWVTIGAVLPSAARGASDIKYFSVAMTGGTNNNHASANLDTATGVLQLRSTGATFTWTTNAVLTLNLSWIY